MIPQPPIPADIPVAPESERVDLNMPTFSDPTNVTNPLFPVSKQDSVLMVGHVDGKPFRTEVTLLPETRIIEWQGQRIETLVSQYRPISTGASRRSHTTSTPRLMMGPSGTSARTSQTSRTALS